MLRILLLPIALIREIQDHPMTLTVTPHLLKDTDSATAAIRLASTGNTIDGDGYEARPSFEFEGDHESAAAETRSRFHRENDDDQNGLDHRSMIAGDMVRISGNREPDLWYLFTHDDFIEISEPEFIIECGQCEGTGRTQSASNLEDEECPVCDGDGEIIAPRDL